MVIDQNSKAAVVGEDSGKTSRSVEPRRRHRRTGFRLLTLMILMAAGCVVLAAVANEFHRERQRHLAVVQLRAARNPAQETPADPNESAGVVVGWLRLLLGSNRFPVVESVNLANFDSKRDLSLIKLFPELKGLEIQGHSLTDESFAQLSDFEHLERLSINDSQLTDNGIASIVHFQKLKTLHLQGGAISDVGLAHLVNLPELSTLSLANCQVTDQGLKTLANVKSLLLLEISGTAVTPEGLVELREQLRNLSILVCTVPGDNCLDLPSIHIMQSVKAFGIDHPFASDALLTCLKDAHELERLDLQGDKITDEGLFSLQNLSKLIALRIQSSAVTDRGLAHLQDLQSLRTLMLMDTAVTKEGVDKLQKTLPKCRIVVPRSKPVVQPSQSDSSGTPSTEFTRLGQS